MKFEIADQNLTCELFREGIDELKVINQNDTCNTTNWYIQSKTD